MYRPKPAKKKKLRRSNSANTRLGLSVILHADEDNYEVAENNFFGFKVFIILLGYTQYDLIGTHVSMSA